jgi:chromosome segregation ATPase
MVFSAGNVIVLLIVLVILAIYRQLDRNNRSLEKVKRYAERVQADLDSIVEEKATQIKDMGIELEVHQKAAREVLNRIQSLEDGLNERASQIERIGTRIGDYDTALDELMKMTSQAEENINRIREESEYIDTVGKRIKSSQAQLQELEGRIPEIVDEFEARNVESLKDAEERAVQHADDRVVEIRNDIESAEQQVRGLEEQVGRARERGEELAGAVEQDIRGLHEELHETTRSEVQQFKASVDQFASRFAEVEADYQARLESAAARGEKLEHSALEKIKEHIHTRFRDVGAQVKELAAGNLAELRGHVQESVQEIQTAAESWKEEQKRVVSGLGESLSDLEKRFGDRIGEVEKLRVDYAEQLKNLRGELGSRRSELENEITKVRSELSEKLTGATEGVEERVLGEVENRLSDYEEQISYRFNKLEQVNTDLDNLEGVLRQAMAGTEERIKEDFAAFGRELEERRQEDRREAGEVMQGIRNEMQELETGIQDLKSRAYDNVSEKLQGFEDDFLSDLKSRSIAMDQKLVEWQQGVDNNIEELAEQFRSDRTNIEQQYTEGLRTGLADLQNRFYSQFEKFEQQVSDFQQSVSARIQSSEGQIESFEESTRQEVDEMKKRAERSFQQEFARHSEQVSDQIDRFEKELHGRIQQLQEQVEEGTNALTASVENAKSDTAVWRARVENDLKGAEETVTGRVSDLEDQIRESVRKMQSEYEQEKEELFSKLASERDTMREDLATLRDRVSTLRADLDTQVKESMDEFRKQYTTLEQQLTERAGEVASESEERINEFKSTVSDVREQFDGMQKKLFGRIDDEARILSVRLEEIDKRTKNFVEQTKIFERADSLKISLQETVEDLKAELSKVEAQRDEAQEIQAQFAKIRKLSGEATEKMTRFLSEKRRIDALEDDFKKLMGMSQAVEVKLQNLTATDDTIQTVQAKLRGLDDIEKQVEERYDRLEKKKSIVDVTTQGVDKNFQQLEDLEQRLESLDQELRNLPQQIGTLESQVRDLSAHKKDADQAMKQVSQLDDTLADIEARMQELQTAREWLARTETRLEEVGREAQEQVKLLGSLLREDGKSGGSTGKGEGAPSMSARETVIKLARQGWKVDEIARQMKVSRGEVELILELAGKAT